MKNKKIIVMKNTLFAVLRVTMLSFVLVSSASAQGLRGYVRDNVTSSPLWGVTLVIKGSTTSVVTDQYGYYYFPVAPTGETVVASHIGYHSSEVFINDTATVQDFFLDPILVPSVSTASIFAITTTTVTAGGEVLSDDGDSVTYRGLCWSTSPNPTTSGLHSQDGTGLGAFSRQILGLLPSTSYHLRTYASNSVGTGYGKDTVFTTSPISPVVYNSASNYGTLTDIESNVYKTIRIGTQEWMADNLKTRRYNDNTPILQITDPSEWVSLTSPAFCWFNNDEAMFKGVYGALYNWYSVNTGKLCPAGWHTPSKDDWDILNNYLGGTSSAGGKLKEAGLAHWVNPNTGADNGSGFTALPGGDRVYDDGSFDGLGIINFFWTSTENNSSTAWIYSLTHNNSWLTYGFDSKNWGLSVRCVKLVQDTLIVTNVSDSGPGSLRKAIEEANANSGPNVIMFNIPGAGPFTVKPLTPLPEVTEELFIDGFSQMGNFTDTASLMINLDGSAAGSGTNGLTINAYKCYIRGISISKFSGDGIIVVGGSGNIFNYNSIFDNGGIGINLGTDRVTPNDARDTDTGPNNLQNHPVLDSIYFHNDTVTISGNTDSKAGLYDLEFFANRKADTTGYGEGQRFIGSSGLTSFSANASFAFSFPVNTIYGDVISAIATAYDTLGNTSEFSNSLGGLPDQVLGGMPFHYRVNGDGVPKIPADTVRNVVTRAFNAWSAVQTADISFTYDGATTGKYANASDGINLVSFTDDQYPFSPGVLAITAKTTRVGANDAENKIIDADIVFNPSFVRSTVYNLGIADNLPYAGYFDIQSIVTHEAGHILGLLHSGVFYSTMFFQIDRGMDFRSLERDDKSWASCKYPLSTYHGFGSISGNITYGYDNQPVAGALVLAINTSARDTVHAYSDANGNYLVPGLLPGSYDIFIEPLDGNVYGRPLSPKNISLYIYTNTKYTDYPGEFYSGNSESSIETTDIITPVAVSAGSVSSGRNFITNKDITPPFVVKVAPPDPKISTDILIRFSEPVDISTFTDQSCYLVKSGDSTPLGGTYTVMGDSTHIILFTPAAALGYSTNYTLHITRSVTDLKGNGLTAEYQSGFKTGAGDKVPPAVTDIIPENGADSVFVTQNILLFFSEPMDKASVESSLSVAPSIQRTFSWDNENKVVTVTPSVSLAEGQTYSVTLTTGAKDLSGIAMAGNLTFSFKTVIAAAPAIIYLGPAGNSTGISVNTPVVVDFSEPINISTINSSTFSLSGGGGQVAGSFEFLNDNSRVIFRPSAYLLSGNSYTIRLTTGITDVSPAVMPLQNGITSMFTTSAALSRPHVDYIEPPAGDFGSVVMISGSGFDPNPANNSVSFTGNNGSTVTAEVTGATLGSLSAIVPAGAVSGPFMVSTKGTPMDNDPASTYFYVVPQTLYPPCDQLISNIKTGSGSRDVTATKDGATAYVTNSGSNTVSVIDMTSLTTKYAISVGEMPMKIDISPDGSRAYVTNFASHTVSVIDLTKKPEVVSKTIKVGGINPYGVAVSPDNKYVYVANYTSENISIIDVDPNSGGFDHAMANINTGTRNRDAAVSPDASMLVVAGDEGLKLIRISRTATGFDYVISNSSSGSKTRDVAIKPDGQLAFVTTLENELMVIDINPESSYFGAVVANANTGSRPGDVKGDFNGMFAYVTKPDDGQVSVYQLSGDSPGNTGSSSQPMSLTLYKTINAGTDPEGLIINPKVDAYQLMVVNSGGTAAKNGSLSVFTICCAANTASEDIGNVIYLIQDFSGRKIISRQSSDMLVNKMNDALQNISKGKTKTAINSLNTFINKVKDMVSNKQIPAYEGNQLIEAAKKIIAKLQVSRSALADSTFVMDKQEPELISVSKLGEIYPNPFSTTVTINYQIADDSEFTGKVLIRIFDSSGRTVSTLADQVAQPGFYSVIWDGRYENGMQPGVGSYFILFRYGSIKEVRLLMLMK